MCCCNKPNVNGTVGAYSWDGKSYSTRQPSPPELLEGEELLCDEPGRCGGLDCHSHHFRLVRSHHDYLVVVRHGGGDERVSLGTLGRLLCPSFNMLDSNGRYWLMHTIYSTHGDAHRASAERTAYIWQKAVVEKRIRTNKARGSDRVKVWIEPDVRN